jgi:hypothetical protein
MTPNAQWQLNDKPGTNLPKPSCNITSTLREEILANMADWFAKIRQYFSRQK